MFRPVPALIEFVPALSSIKSSPSARSNLVVSRTIKEKVVAYRVCHNIIPSSPFEKVFTAPA